MNTISDILTWQKKQGYRGFLDICGDNDYMSLSFAGKSLFLDQFKWKRAESVDCSEFTRYARVGPQYFMQEDNVPQERITIIDKHPRYRLDGSKIDDNLEYSVRIITEVLIRDLCRMLEDIPARTIIEYGVPPQRKDGFVIDGGFLLVSNETDGYYSIRHKVSIWIRPIIGERN